MGGSFYRGDQLLPDKINDMSSWFSESVDLRKVQETERLNINILEVCETSVEKQSGFYKWMTRIIYASRDK